MLIGYARCSTDQQSVTAQVEMLKAAGSERIFSENASGIVTDRRGLAKAISALGPGDVLCVTKLDRLGRSLKDVLNTLQTITEKGAGFKVLDNPAFDKSNAYGQLLLTVLGALAQLERDLIIARTSEGQDQSKSRRAEIWPEAQPNGTPTSRGPRAPKTGRDADGIGRKLRREPFDNFEAW